MKFLGLVLKNLRRNLVRTLLTALGTMVLVFVVMLVWSVLFFLDQATSEKSKNLKMIVTERWQIPSQMPFAYATTLTAGAARKEGDIRPMGSMTWSFFGGTIDPNSRAPENFVFAIGTQPSVIMSMMEELDELQGPERDRMLKLCEEMGRDREAMIVGVETLSKLNKKVGDRIKLSGMIYKDINLEFRIIGTFPESIARYTQSAVFDRDYLYDALDVYQREHGGNPHPLAQRNMNLVWLRVRSNEEFQQVSQQIESSPLYSSPAVKCETLSSAVSNFIDAYRDLIWGMRYLLSPAILVTLSLVISNAISISVRERQKELAVLKVLGFRPWHLLGLVLGEALLIGALGGAISAGLTFYIINYVKGGLNFPIAFFPAFTIPVQALGWGLAVGVGSALLGSLLPAWNARRVRVSDVFSKVT